MLSQEQRTLAQPRAGSACPLPAFDQVATELAQARALLMVNARAAGAVCGVALERALGTVAHEMDGTSTRSVRRLGSQLWQAGCLTPEQHLAIKRVATMRARCVHAYAPPTVSQVERMIAYAYQVVAALAEGDTV